METVTGTAAKTTRLNGYLFDQFEQASGPVQLDTDVERFRSSVCAVTALTANQSADLRDEDVVIDDSLGSSFSSLSDLVQGLGIIDKAWSQSTITPDNDSQSFFTTLTNQKSGASLKSHFDGLKDAARLAEAQGALGTHPALLEHHYETSSGSAESVILTDKTHLQSSKGCKKAERTEYQASAVNEKATQINGHPVRRAASSSSTSSGTQKSTTNVKWSPPLQLETFYPPRIRSRRSVRLPRSQNQKDRLSHDSEIQLLFPEKSLLSSGRNSPGARYLQEARRSAPLVSSPLSNIIRSAKANMSTSALAQSGIDLRATFSGIGGNPSLPPPLSSSASSASSSSQRAAALAPTSPPSRVPRQEPEQLAKIGRSATTKPIAKMLVECCHCKFFHDMPSRVYECMAQPDTVVTDRGLGVSGAITTMVKCPWCSHNMSTQCCAGYAAVIYLKEKMH
ncbi:hypothetical protein SEPCBS57363_003338 [Sporothrix epigloea]|uniref:Uncharacterized protein n=1 Tax=Sporothrix epigloea TaxID=1892477 RepID=A0ABP0DM56_9PEZI